MSDKMDCRFCRTTCNGGEKPCTDLAAAKDCPWMSRGDWDALDAALAHSRPVTAGAEPMAYYIEHAKHGVELSLDPIDEASQQRGWTATPLYAAPPAAAGRRDLAERLLHAMITMQNDNDSKPMSEERLRHTARYETMGDVLEYLRSDPSVTPQEPVVVWLIEWPEDDNVPVRWWHPVGGWMRDANMALWLSREADAASYIATHHMVAGIKPTEHIFVSTLPRADGGAK